MHSLCPLRDGIKKDITHPPPEQLAASILDKEKRIADFVRGIQQLLKP